MLSWRSFFCVSLVLCSAICADAQEHLARLRTAQQLQSPITLDDSPPKQTESKIRPVVPLIEPKPVQPARNLLTLPRPSMEEAEPKIVAADLSQPAYSLPSFIQMAIENHPTLKSAGARIKVAEYEALQAGLAPNPKLGLFADEVGNEDDPGLIGVYLQRNIIRGNKLCLSREIKNREATVREIELQQQAIRIETDVTTAYYRVLISQKKSELTRQLFESQTKAVQQSRALYEAGETPRTDLLQTELQTQKTNMLLQKNEVELQNAWRQLLVMTGADELEWQPLSGSLDPFTESVSFEEILSKIFDLSPQLRVALAEVQRVQATIHREIAATVPDYQTQLTVGKDSTTEHFFAGVQLQIPLMVCDRNQGNIAAAKSRLVEAVNNVETIKRRIRQRLTQQFEKYQSAQVRTNLYQTQLIPQARKNLELLKLGYPEEVEFLQVLSAQQSIVELTLEYLDSLNDFWASRLRMEGLLLEESLEK